VRAATKAERCSLQYTPPDRHLAPRADQHDLAVGVGDAERQDLGHHRADLARREVDDGKHQAAGEVLEAVVPGDLGRGFLDADVGAEVDRKAIGGLSRLREGLGRDDAADADVDLEEVVEGDLRHRGLHLRLSFRGAPRGASPEPITTGLSDSHRF
jgi:hypothetical protein